MELEDLGGDVGRSPPDARVFTVKYINDTTIVVAVNLDGAVRRIDAAVPTESVWPELSEGKLSDFV